ncbi:sigma factor-like helix-turn-helix DNA-binding protein [Streptomyces tendae]|uniref:sigma factor-like helix-turn-helix DNA-binding protein n=1 Tax=Streptomyces tendae TaxID=1932 RepID=UPI003787403B
MSRKRQTPDPLAVAYAPSRPEESFRHGSTAESAFDALYVRAAPGLLHQTHLLTGRRGRAFQAVEYAFSHAWEYWPEVAVDSDPVGWVRSHAYEYALSPWHRFRELVDREEPAPTCPLHRALVRLSARHRRALLLCDGLGLTIAQAAAELEASCAATESRLLGARAVLAECFPDSDDHDALPLRIRTLVAEGSTATVPTAGSVRAESERRLRLLTRSVAGAVAVLGGLVCVSILTTSPWTELPTQHARTTGATQGLPDDVRPRP